MARAIELYRPLVVKSYSARDIAARGIQEFGNHPRDREGTCAHGVHVAECRFAGERAPFAVASTRRA
jgi:hypothetical protein